MQSWFVKRRRAQNPDDYETWQQGGVSPTLNAFDNTGDSRATILVLAYDPGVIGPLTATGMTRARGTESVESHHVLCFTAQRVGEPPRIYENTTPSLLSRMGTGGNNTPMIAIPIQDGREIEKKQNGIGFGTENDPAYTLDQTGAQAVATESVVRRLTPVECERLMGWPDNHTLYRADGKTNSDSTRYKMCGNGVATPVAEWIATQLKELL